VEQQGSRKSKKKAALSRAQARNAVYIDFEGEGKSATGEMRPPHMIGILRPAIKGKGGSYKSVFFSEFWGPAANGVYQTAVTCDFDEFFTELADEVVEKNKHIVIWSIYEEDVIRQFLKPDLQKRILPRIYNLRPLARKYLRLTRRLQPDETVKGKPLEEFTALIFQKRNPFPPIDIGAAEACRRIDTACQSNKRWKNFSDKQKKYVHDLVAYNKGDCRATWLISLRLGNFFDSRV